VHLVRSTTLLVVLGCLAAAPAAQTRRAQRTDLLPLELIAVRDLPPINHPALEKEDRERKELGLPGRFALPFDVDVSPWTDGTWETLEPGLLLWRYRVRSVGASNLNLGFDVYHLTPGASLHLHSADGVHVVRAFTAADNESHGELWTPVVASDDLVVELRVPEKELADLRLHLKRIGQGYRPFGGRPSAQLLSGSCNVDVICAEGDDWRLEIPSVGVISTGGSTFCTGFMVTNVREDLKPFFMTANHCGISSTNAASLVVYWNYENSTCRVPGSAASGGPGDGSLAQFNTGSIFRASSSFSDMTLVELDDDPDPAWELSWAGWDATGADASMAIAIHHPNTDEKRISFEYQPTTTTTYLQNAIPGNGSHVRIEDWDLGTTEPGSSGSPLFNQDHHVIGQLHGGFASCTSQTSDWYGKFSESWIGAGTPSTRLSNWLDPDATGTLIMDTVSLDTLCSDAGTLEFDRATVACEATLGIRLVDCALDTDELVTETAMLLVTSTSEPAGETVMLTESSPTSARFLGTLVLSATDGPGVLQVAEGDTISATYVDADDGMGGVNVPVNAAATVDCTAPNVTSVSLDSTGPTSFTVTVQTDEPARVTLDAGTSCGAYTLTASSEGLATSTTLSVNGLFPDTFYAFRAVAMDEAGNASTDDNGGSCYGAMTDDVPLAFTEEFLGDADLDFQSLLLVPDAGPDGYVVCRRRILDLPTPFGNATNLNLSDDGTAQVNLTGGRTVQLYGEQFTRVFVAANGGVTFDAANGDYTETLAEHFAEKRISVFWDDFNPASAGAVLSEQKGDRLVVTWFDVPQFNTSDSNTFQLELFFDGRIRMSWAAMDSNDSIVGLSAGLGTPPAFVETNLSAAPRCDRPVTTTVRPQ